MFGRKGQAAMEYLMTYGWALLVIFIVIAVLYILSTQITSGESCSFDQPGLICNNPAPPILTGNKLAGRLINGYGKTIIVTSIGCSTDRTVVLASGALPSTVTGPATFTGTTGSISPQSNMSFSAVTCNGPSTISAGSDFRGALYVTYYYADDSSTNVRLGRANLMVRSQ